MADLQYKISINAPKDKVWQIMLGAETYREWTSAFQLGSTFDGSWDKGSKIKFVSEDDGKTSGMFCRVVENVLYEYISLELLGEIVDGQEDTASEEAKQWIGSHESYRFSEQNGVTNLAIELAGDNMSPEIANMFDAMWPKALQKLKEICEQQN